MILPLTGRSSTQCDLCSLPLWCPSPPELPPAVPEESSSLPYRCHWQMALRSMP